MDTGLYTFIDIFGSEFEVEGEMVSLNRIVIPIIQRDYAQGREDDETKRIRARFLESLYQSIVGEPIKLDFIYGDIDTDGVMTPLDGQQRLTTLFLLHWYAAKKAQVSQEEYDFLTKFSYETRYSARDFCHYLIRYTPSFTEKLSVEIIDQPWFPLDWKKDATIKSMLVMIDAIHNKFEFIDILWERLKDGAIGFYFLPLHDLGLTDELYIKMNSRGKPLYRMPAILRQVDSIIIKGKMNEKESNNFNAFQLEEEKEKLVWVEKHPEYAEQLFALEDHDLLYGQISIIGLEHPENFEKFQELFACEWDLVDQAMMVIGDYTQRERNQWRYQFGSSAFEKAWANLFHKNANTGYENTKSVLNKLLSSMDVINNKQLKRKIDVYLKECECNKLFEWRYYYVKYKEFRPGRYGKYSWKDLKNGRYEMHVMWTQTQWSENSYHPFLYAADSERIWREYNGHLLEVGDEYIAGENDAFVFYDIETDEEIRRIDISRNEENIDTEDRIVKLKKYLKKYLKQ